MAEICDTSSSAYDSVPLPLGKSMYIRVIKIRPSTNPDFLDRIVCDLSILDVDSGTLLVGQDEQHQHNAYVNTPDAGTHLQAMKTTEVEYKALSYTWGDAGADHEIMLNNTPFSVKKNLWDFLHMARMSKMYGYLWIDARCINQATIAEKSHQVGMMGEVYPRASCVIVWLGTRTAAEEFGFQSVLETLDHYASTDDLPASWHNIVFRFGSLDYWRRAWIVQEYLLGKRKEIWYGRLRIDSARIKHMIECYETMPREGEMVMFWTHVSMIAKEVEYRSTERFGTFTNLTALFWYMNCRDSRDRVYALLPLLSPEEREDLGLYPDYSISATTIFLQLVERLWNGLDGKKHPGPHPVFRHLEHMLRPNLQENAVQMAILELALRGKHLLFGMHNLRGGENYSNPHRCVVFPAPLPIIGVTGCSVCSRKPFFSLDNLSYPKEEDGKFSESDWNTYIQALLTSEDVRERELAMKYHSILYLDQGTSNARLRSRIARGWKCVRKSVIRHVDCSAN